METVNNPLSNDSVESIEATIEELKQHIALGDALNRLFSNPDFKHLIEEELLKSEVLRLVRSSAYPGNKNPDSQELIKSRLSMTAELQLYFNQIFQVAEAARRDLPENYQVRDDLAQQQS